MFSHKAKEELSEKKALLSWANFGKGVMAMSIPKSFAFRGTNADSEINPIIVGLFDSPILVGSKKSGKIGQNQENRDRIKSGPRFPSKHDNCDRMHQITVHYKRNLQNIQLMLLFSR